MSIGLMMQSHLIVLYLNCSDLLPHHRQRRRDLYLIQLREPGTGSMGCKRDCISFRGVALVGRHFGALVQYTVVLYFGGALPLGY